MPNPGAEAFRRSRDLRYRACSDATEYFASRGWDVVVEGTFSRSAWRAPILHFARQSGLQVILIRCSCRDRRELLRRQEARRTSDFGGDRNVAPYRQKGVRVPRVRRAEIRGIVAKASFDVDTAVWSMNRVPSFRPASPVEGMLRSWLAVQKAQ